MCLSRKTINQLWNNNIPDNRRFANRRARRKIFTELKIPQHIKYTQIIQIISAPLRGKNRRILSTHRIVNEEAAIRQVSRSLLETAQYPFFRWKVARPIEPPSSRPRDGITSNCRPGLASPHSSNERRRKNSDSTDKMNFWLNRNFPFRLRRKFQIATKGVPKLTQDLNWIL